MKEYKIDLSMYEGKVRSLVSKAIQARAFFLGSGGWTSCGKEINHTDAPYLIILKGGFLSMLSENDVEYFNNKENPEISAADFLTLTPESVKDAPEFKPFDRVLVRDGDDETWRVSFFGHIQGKIFQYKCASGCFNQCIPYEGNEHLLGTTEAYSRIDRWEGVTVARDMSAGA